MKKGIFILRHALFAVLVGILVAFFLNLSKSDKYVSARNLFTLNNEINTLRQEVEVLKEWRRHLEDQLASAEFAFSGLREQYEDVLSEELNQLKAFAGYTDISGPGIIIIVQDGERELMHDESANNLIVHDTDLMDIVESLRNAGAEAISINDERIILESTQVRCVGPVIMINGVQLAPPFVIKAIGDRKILAATMSTQGGLLDELRGWGLRVEINTAKHIEIFKIGVNGR